MATRSGNLSQIAGTLRAEIEAALDRYTGFDDDCPARLREAIRYSLLGPGKRLRPMLVLMATEACGGERKRALPAACAVEMIHAYSLIHDDLPAMDDDDLRRGRPSCHAAYGEALAILAGDALIPRAFELLARELHSPSVAAACCGALASAAGASALVGGQVDDLTSDPGVATLEWLERIHRRKTGALFRVSLELGGLVAEAAPTELAALDGYGRDLGLAFQIVDDLLDHCGTAEQVGKRTGKDVERGKVTFPGMLGVEGSRQRATELVSSALRWIEPFEGRADGLRQLAYYVLERNR